MTSYSVWVPFCHTPSHCWFSAPVVTSGPRCAVRRPSNLSTSTPVSTLYPSPAYQYLGATHVCLAESSGTVMSTGFATRASAVTVMSPVTSSRGWTSQSVPARESSGFSEIVVSKR